MSNQGLNTRRSEDQEVARGEGGFWYRRPQSPLVFKRPLKAKKPLPKMLGTPNNHDYFSDYN